MTTHWHGQTLARGPVGACCTARMWGDPDGLVCAETGPHDDHVYVASAGAMDAETGDNDR